MALRKHLRNGKVSDIQQHEFERVIVIGVSTREGEFQLISELFGQGNIILVSPEKRILQALAYRKMRDRNVLRGEVFQHAPSSGRNPLNLSLQDLGEIKRLGKLEIVRALTRFLSIGGLYAEEILLRAQVGKYALCESLTEPQTESIFDQLHQILSVIKAGNVEPRVIIDRKGELIDVVPIRLKKYADFEQKMYKTFNEALDEYYTEATVEEKVVEAAKEVDRRLAKERRILQSQQKALDDSRAKIERNRRIGDTIFSHLGELQLLLQRILDEKKGGNSWEQIASSIDKEKEEGKVPVIYFDSLEPQRLIVHVSVEDMVFPLNLRRSAQTNGADYYAKAKRAQRKLKGTEQAIQETRSRIEELQKRWIIKMEETRKPPIKKPKKAWYEKFRWFYSSDDFLVVGGRDATTNEILIKKHMEDHDVVFHADILGAPFVLIKTEGKTPSEQTTWESAEFAASYSRAWKKSLGAVDVYWFSPQQISKSPPPGQRLRKGAFMIHGSKNYIRNVPLGLAIGVLTKEEELIVVGGPLGAISKHTNTYVKIVPGEQSSGKLAKQIRQLLAEKVSGSLRKKVLEIPLDEIQKFIPSGRGDIKSKSS